MTNREYDKILLPLGYIYWNLYPLAQLIPFVGHTEGHAIYYRMLSWSGYGDLTNHAEVWVPLEGLQSTRVLRWAERKNRASLERFGVTDELIALTKVLELCP